MKLGITMPTRTVPLGRVAEYARWADEAGLDSVWDWELYRYAFSLTGTPGDVRGRLSEWEGIVDHLVFHTPYVPPFTAEESEECYRNICAAFRR